MSTRSRASTTSLSKPVQQPRKFFEKSNKNENKRGIFDYFRLSESYTSLVLGIVVVIITAVLLVSFVKNRNIGQLDNVTKDISSISTVVESPTPEVSKIPVSPTATITPFPTRLPTATSTPWPTSTPRPIKVISATSAIEPSTAPKATSTITAKTSLTKKVDNRAVPTSVPVIRPVGKGKVYTVVKGDSLWKIAEREYKSGYNWVDIAKANKLSNPGSIHNGDKLVIPSATPKKITVAEPTKVVVAKTTPTSKQTMGKITANTYTVVKGDTLWNIAVRAYGDGYKWVDISKANKIVNPNVIHSGNKLVIPRK